MTEELPPGVLESEKFSHMVVQVENFIEKNLKSETCLVPSNLESEQQSERVIEENNDEAIKVNLSHDA